MFNNGATNGIKHNGARVSDVMLAHGTELEIGDVLLAFSLTDEESDTLA
jgi:hypothetical protein